jgi:hypothetical protein
MNRRIAAALAFVLMLLAEELWASPAVADDDPLSRKVPCDQLPMRISLPGFHLECIAVDATSSGSAIRQMYDAVSKVPKGALVLPFLKAANPLDADLVGIIFGRNDATGSNGIFWLATSNPSPLSDVDLKEATLGFAASYDAMWGGKSELDWGRGGEVQGYHVVRFIWLRPVNILGGGPEACFAFVRYGAPVGGTEHHTRAFGQYCERPATVPIPPVSDHTIDGILGALPKAD